MPDPWAEQTRRSEMHRRQRRLRRRRRLRRLAGSALLVTATAGVAGVAISNESGPDRGDVRSGATQRDAIESVTTAVIASTDVAPTESSIDPERLVQVDRVWLIDRGDATYDWGVSVRAPEGASKRSGVVIDVRLLDADDDVVEVASTTVDGIGPRSVGTFAGRLHAADAVPVRIEFDVAVGVPSNDHALADRLAVRGLRRIGESVTGRIVSDDGDPIEDVTMVLLWFDDAGDVVAAVPHPVGRIRPDTEQRVDVDLRDEVVPDGRPDFVGWSR